MLQPDTKDGVCMRAGRAGAEPSLTPPHPPPRLPSGLAGRFGLRNAERLERGCGLRGPLIGRRLPRVISDSGQTWLTGLA